jgi:hypothetical protein
VEFPTGFLNGDEAVTSGVVAAVALADVLAAFV